MKNLKKLFGIISIIAIIACTMAACELFNDKPQDQTPVAGDYDIGNLKQSTNNVTAVTITPKSGKSGGARTIYYEGTGGSAKSITIPQIDGAYVVTFDVAAATGWNAATGLYAGTLIVGIPTPVAGDFIISNLTQTAGKVKAVTITPKEGKSTGKIKIWYTGIEDTNYPKSDKFPENGAVGSEYAVTFDIAEATGWKAATGLSAGTLEINDNKTPVLEDYHVDGWGQRQSTGSAIRVTVSPVEGRDISPGRVTPKYNGETNPSSYTEGSYRISLDVEETTGWNAATLTTDYIMTIIPAGSTGGPSLSVTIDETPDLALGDELFADYQKNFSGTVGFQWLRDDVPISYQTNQKYTLKLADAGKAIKVKVTCGGRSAVSMPVTIPSVTYTVEIRQYGDNSLYAMPVAVVDGEEYTSYADEDGFRCQWLRNGTPISGATSASYALQSIDKGKKIRARVTSSYSLQVLSEEIQISEPDSELAGTTWKYENIPEVNYKDVYILKFSNDYNTWTMDYTSSSPYGGSSGRESGTYTVSGNDIVLRGGIFVELSGVINGGDIVFSYYSYGNSYDLVFTKQP